MPVMKDFMMRWCWVCQGIKSFVVKLLSGRKMYWKKLMGKQPFLYTHSKTLTP